MTDLIQDSIFALEKALTVSDSLWDDYFSGSEPDLTKIAVEFKFLTTFESICSDYMNKALDAIRKALALLEKEGKV